MKRIGLFFVSVIFLSAMALFLYADPQPPLNTTVSVSPKQVHYVVGGKDVTPQDGLFFNGQLYLPDALEYQGTIYVPLRFAAQALQQKIKWDGKGQTVSIDGGAPQREVYLSDLMPQSRTMLASPETVFINNAAQGLDSGSASNPYWTPPMKINDQAYEKGFSFQLFDEKSAELSWQLNGEYSTLDMSLGLDSQTHSGAKQDDEAYLHTIATVIMNADNKTLKSIEIGPSTTPSTITLPLSGVKTLTIHVDMRTTPNNLAMLDLVNPLLH